MSKRQNSLLEIWSSREKKQKTCKEVGMVSLLSDDDECKIDEYVDELTDLQEESCHPPEILVSEIVDASSSTGVGSQSSNQTEDQTTAANDVEVEEIANNGTEHHSPSPEPSDTSVGSEFCQSSCCSNIKEPYQPKDSKILGCLASHKHNFMPNWYQNYPWLSVCKTKKMFCFYCRYAQKQNMLTFNKRGEDTFITTGYSNWKKALEKFNIHSLSITHHIKYP